MTQIWEACRADILNYIMIFLRSALVIGAIWGVCRWLRTVVQEEDGIKLTILGILLYMIEYVVVSGFLFLIDSYGITRTLLSIFLWNMISMLSWSRKKEKKKLFWDWKRYAPLLAFAIIGLFLMSNKNEYYGMQQDQGVYETSAIAMIYGNTSNEKVWKEYDMLPESDQKRFLHLAPTELNGLYFYNEDYADFYTTQFSSEASAYFHGIPTFPAVLALWGSVFGMEHMIGVQSVIFCILLGLLYLFLQDYGCKNWVTYLCCGTLTFSPLVIWVGKAALTEMLIACFFMGYLYFLVKEDKASIMLSTMCIWGFAFLHLTIYTMIPIVMLLYLGLFFTRTQKIYLYAGSSAIVGFALGILLVRSVSTEYFYRNIPPLTGLLPFLNNENIFPILFHGSVICGVVLLLWGILYQRRFGKLKFKRLKKEKSKRQTIFQGKLKHFSKKDRLKESRIKLSWEKVSAWGIRIILVGCIAGATAQFIQYGEDWAKLTIAGLFYMTGILLLLAALLWILWKPSVVQNLTGGCTFVLMVYCIFFYSFFLRQEISYYYYYARYLVPYLMAGICVGGIVWNEIKGKYVAIGLCSAEILTQVACFLPYDVQLLIQKDDSRTAWNTLEEINRTVQEGDLVVIDDTLVSQYLLPLEFMSKAKIIPQMGYSYESVQDHFHTEGTLYYLSGDVDITGMRQVLRITEEVSEDTQDGERGWIGLPTSFEAEEEVIRLQEHMTAQYEYTAGEDVWFNMSPVLEDGSRWGYGSEYGLQAYLAPGDYIVTVHQSQTVPVEIYGVRYYSLEVYVNGVYLSKLRANKNKDIIFRLPSKYLVKGENIITFSGEPWKPNDFKEDDYRELGINIQRMTFKVRE